MQTLNLEQLKAATQAGGVTGITLRGEGAAFVVNVQTQRGEAMMVTSRQQPRRFADPRKALQVLRSVGWTQCRIDASLWQPEAQMPQKRARPDRSAALKAAHQAVVDVAQADADYDHWFRAKAQAALDGLADGSNPVLSDAQVDARRTALQQRVRAMEK